MDAIDEQIADLREGIADLRGQICRLSTLTGTGAAAVVKRKEGEISRLQEHIDQLQDERRERDERHVREAEVRHVGGLFGWRG